MIAFLHTSPVHIDRFERLVRKYHPTIAIQHFVKEDILQTALANGQLDKITFLDTIQAIQKNKPSLTICTCSTYGQLCDQLSTVHRIDQPIVREIVAKYSSIAVAYTAHSTKAISLDILHQTAKRQGKLIRIIECDCTHCWPYFEAGDIKKYETEIAKTIRTKTNKSEVVFLAQASMEGAAAYLNDLKQAVVSSPEFGIKTLLQSLES